MTDHGRRTATRAGAVLGATAAALVLAGGMAAASPVGGPAGDSRDVAPQPRDTNCVVEPRDGSVDVHAEPDTASAVVTTLTTTGRTCPSVQGAAYTECGGGTLWYRTIVNTRTGYVPARCVSLIE